MEKELQKEDAWVPLTPTKPIPARLGFESANGEWKKHLGQSFQHMNLQKFLHFDAMISKNISLYHWDVTSTSLEAEDPNTGFAQDVLTAKFIDKNLNGPVAGRTCLSYSVDMLGMKGAEMGGSGPSHHSDGSENICLMHLSGMPDTISAFSELVSENMASRSQLDSSMSTRGAVVHSIPRICTETPATPHPINTEGAHKAAPRNSIQMPITPPPMKTQAVYQTIQGNIFQIFASPQHDGPSAVEETPSNKSQCNVSLASDSVLKLKEKNIQKRQHSGEIGSSKKLRGSRSRMKKHRPKVFVEGMSKRVPKAHTPKAPKTPKALSSKRKRGAGAKPCKRMLNFNLEDQENVDDISQEMGANSCKRVLNFNLKDEENVDTNTLAIAVSNNLIQEQREDVRKNELEGSEKFVDQQLSEQDVDEQSNYLNMGKQETSEADRKLIHRPNIIAEKGNLNSNMVESNLYIEMSTDSAAITIAEVNKCKEEHMVEYPHRRYGFSNCIWAQHMPRAEREALDYQHNLPITNQSGSLYNSLQVYQRKLHVNQCQKNSRKLGPNFPMIYKKKRTRRQKAAVVKSLWCINAEIDERQVTQELSRCKQSTKRNLVQHTTWKRVKKRTKKSKVCRNSAIVGCSYHANYRFLPWAALNDPEAFERALSLCPIAVSRRKRSALARTHILPSPLKIPEQFSLASILDFGKHGINACGGKASAVQLTGKEYFTIGTQNTMEVSYNSLVAFNSRVDNSLEIQKFPLSVLDTEYHVDHCFEKFPAKQEVSVLNIEDCAPIHQDDLSTNENKEPIPSADTCADGSFQRGLTDVIQKLKSLDINKVRIDAGHGALIKVDLPRKGKKTVVKVDLDEETLRVWNLLKENGDQPFEKIVKDKEEWWEKEREVFRGRVDSFVVRMHAIQGDRRFSRWKGSVVDSVVGVYLTQNVSDRLSSSVFMSLASKFPPKSTSNCSETYVVEEIAYSQDSMGSTIEAYGQVCGRNGSEQDINYITQNVSDHLSRSAFMSLTENISPKSTSNHSENYVVEEIACSQESVRSCVEADRQMHDRNGSDQDTGYQFGDTISDEMSEAKSEKVVSNATPSQKLDAAEEIAHSQVSVGSSIEEDIQVCDRNGSDQDAGNQLGDTSTDEISETKSEHVVSNAFPSQKLEGPFHAENSPTYNKLSFGEQQQLEMESYLQKWTTSKNLPSNDSQDGNLKLSGRKCAKKRSLNEAHNSPEPCTKSLPFDLNVGLLDPSKIFFPAIQNNSQHQTRNRMGRKKPETTPRKMKSKVEEKQETKIDWDELRKSYCKCRGRESGSNTNTSDCVDWEAVRCSTEAEISETIKDRGMNNILAKRIKDFLDRIYKDHGSLDLEWLRDVPPEKAKEYLLSIDGIGLKSVECVRLLTLHHLAFPVDTNVARVAVRLGWVPLQSLPESVPLHLLNAYPSMDSIQKYLWPRLRTLSQLELYELHYQMITFGKVFCTKRKPNCNVCPMKGECRHYASNIASSRILLTKPEGESTVTSDAPFTTDHNLDMLVTPPTPLSFPVINKFKSSSCTDPASEPIIEVPPSPEPESREIPLTPDIEDLFIESDDDDDEILNFKLNVEEFRENVPSIFESNTFSVQGSEMSKGLVALSHEDASARVPKLKHVGKLRTAHQVYELPDSHPLLARFERREPDDLCPYLLAIWTTETSESAESSGQSLNGGNNQEAERYRDGSFSSSCTAIQAHAQESVWGTILIPCRTATRGFFPLNGTYFQVNEVFADDESSEYPIRIPRAWIWDLPRRLLHCGTSATSIFKGLSTEEICYCFWRGYICVRGFNRTTRAPRSLSERLHISAANKTKAKDDE